MRKGVVAVSLCVVLAALWLVLSGRWSDPLTLSLGAVSILIVFLLVWRLGILDGETAPQARIAALVRYWLWLGGEVAKANIAVTRIALSAKLDITPMLVRTPALARTELGRATFANSITLTPGTVTVAVEPGEFVIHALTTEFADDAAFADMGARAIRATEGGAL